MDDCKKKMLSDRELREKEVYGLNGPPKGVEAELVKIGDSLVHISVTLSDIADMFEFIVDRVSNAPDGDA